MKYIYLIALFTTSISLYGMEVIHENKKVQETSMNHTSATHQPTPEQIALLNTTKSKIINNMKLNNNPAISINPEGVIPEWDISINNINQRPNSQYFHEHKDAVLTTLSDTQLQTLAKITNNEQGTIQRSDVEKILTDRGQSIDLTEPDTIHTTEQANTQKINQKFNLLDSIVTGAQGSARAMSSAISTACQYIKTMLNIKVTAQENAQIENQAKAAWFQLPKFPTKIQRQQFYYDIMDAYNNIGKTEKTFHQIINTGDTNYYTYTLYPDGTITKFKNDTIRTGVSLGDYEYVLTKLPKNNYTIDKEINPYETLQKIDKPSYFNSLFTRKSKIAPTINVLPEQPLDTSNTIPTEQTINQEQPLKNSINVSQENAQQQLVKQIQPTVLDKSNTSSSQAAADQLKTELQRIKNLPARTKTSQNNITTTSNTSSSEFIGDEAVV